MSADFGETFSFTIPARKENKPILQIGEFVRFKKRRRVKDKYAMVIFARNKADIFEAQLRLANPIKKKNGYSVERLRRIYKHKPKKQYFT